MTRKGIFQSGKGCGKKPELFRPSSSPLLDIVAARLAQSWIAVMNVHKFNKFAQSPHKVSTRDGKGKKDTQWDSDDKG